MQRKKLENYLIFVCNQPQLLQIKVIEENASLGKLGEEIGLLFQLSDDFLDIKGSKK